MALDETKLIFATVEFKLKTLMIATITNEIKLMTLRIWSLDRMALDRTTRSKVFKIILTILFTKSNYLRLFTRLKVWIIHSI